MAMHIWVNMGLNIWVRSRICGCLVTWFCYQFIAKPGNKTATVSWPDPYFISPSENSHKATSTALGSTLAQVMVCCLMAPSHYPNRLCKSVESFNTLRPKQNGHHFPDNILKCIFLNENVWIPNNISLKFVPKRPINNNPALVQVMAWRRPGDKPLSEPMMVRLSTHICVTQSQWVKSNLKTHFFKKAFAWLLN